MVNEASFNLQKTIGLNLPKTNYFGPIKEPDTSLTSLSLNGRPGHRHFDNMASELPKNLPSSNFYNLA